MSLIPLIRDQKTVSVGVPLDPAGNQTSLFRDQIGPFAVAQQLTFPLHGAKPALEHFLLAAGDVEQQDDFVAQKRPRLFFHDFENVFPRR